MTVVVHDDADDEMRDGCTSALSCNHPEGCKASRHQCNSCIVNCCNLRFFKDIIPSNKSSIMNLPHSLLSLPPSPSDTISLHWGLSAGSSVYKIDALPLSYRGSEYSGIFFSKHSFR